MCLHVVPVVRVQKAVAVKEGGDRTIDGELWVCFNDDRTTISSSHLILVHSYSIAVQTHMCLGVLTQQLTTFMDIRR